ncbi:MAG: hypothetical protein M0Z31_02265 [Clostridia bacterium]|nr:hypothetical protein [Clostridia bacterium]
MGSTALERIKCGFLLVEKELSIPDNLVDLDQVTNINLQPVIHQYRMTEKEQVVEGKLNLQVFYAPRQDNQLLLDDLPAEPVVDENTISYLSGLSKDFFDDGFSDHDELEEETIKVKDNFHFINLETRDWDTIACFQDDGSFSLNLPAGSLWISSENQLQPRVKFVEYQVLDPRTLKVSFLVSLEVLGEETRKEEGVAGDYQVIFQLPPNHPQLEDVVDYYCRLVSVNNPENSESQVYWQLELAFLGRSQGEKQVLGLTKLVQEFAGQLPTDLLTAGVLPVEDTVLTPNGSGSICLAARLPIPSLAADEVANNVAEAVEVAQTADSGEGIEEEINLPEEHSYPIIDEDDNDRNDLVTPFIEYPNPAVERVEPVWLQCWLDCEGMTEKEDEFNMGKKRRREEEKIASAWILDEEENSQEQSDLREEENDDRETGEPIVDEANEDTEDREEYEENDDEQLEEDVTEDINEDTAQDVVHEDDNHDETEVMVAEDVVDEVVEEDSSEPEEAAIEVINDNIVETEQVEPIAEEAEETEEVVAEPEVPAAADFPEPPLQTGPKVAFRSITSWPVKEQEPEEVIEEYQETITMSSRRERLKAALAKGSGAKGNRGYSVMRINPRNS